MDRSQVEKLERKDVPWQKNQASSSIEPLILGITLAKDPLDECGANIQTRTNPPNG